MGAYSPIPSTVANYTTPYGSVTNGYAPLGTPYYQSAPLVRGANGATSTPQGTAANTMAGYVSEYGGGYGADPATAEPNRGLLMDATSQDSGRIANALNSTDPEAQQRAIERLTDPTATSGNRLGALFSSDEGGSYNADWFKTLNPAAQARVTAGVQSGGGDPQATDQLLARLGASQNLTSIGNGTYTAQAGSPEAAQMQAANTAQLQSLGLSPGATPAQIDAAIAAQPADGVAQPPTSGPTPAPINPNGPQIGINQIDPGSLGPTDTNPGGWINPITPFSPYNPLPAQPQGQQGVAYQPMGATMGGGTASAGRLF